MKQYLQKITNNESLSEDEAYKAMQCIFTEASDAQIGAFLAALNVKGITAEELTGFARAMLGNANVIHPEVNGYLVDTCGSGGDRHNTINISTAAAIVTAAAGIPVAKHGNRSVTSLSGSADVLEALGVKVDCTPEDVCSTIENIDIGFMFAPMFHPAMKRVGGVRKDLGVKTVFNLLGPIVNPTEAPAQVVGVYDRKYCKPVAEALRRLGKSRALVVNGDGMDEISTLSETCVVELKDDVVSSYIITPEDLGIPRATANDIVGGTPEENADDIMRILNGEKGPKRDIVVANAAASIYLGRNDISMREAVTIAEEAIDSGKALEKLEQLIDLTNKEA
ncbi:anthranilate phosphoribosyltransferase [Methanohalophilus levihalophilus]|uniref:anthranilate phosphoribosyltransferase n=1 Tax=Methanohalophilus levihalophilus TaxID=1431282 RepID=UPI001AEAB7E4|nr:anthranilate phosphoribosyltransferase [Methanohalophilus levihalophilus]MBP2031103.1 anthranilate phosphoribosyltransferase [Methanohalophilus levihalophilus]